MSSDEYEKLAARLSAVERKLVVIEANSRKACSEQPLVGPPDKSEERPAALARPQTIAEVETLVKEVIYNRMRLAVSFNLRFEIDVIGKMILQRLGTLDQGPVASTPLEEIVSRVNSDSYKSQDIDV